MKVGNIIKLILLLIAVFYFIPQFFEDWNKIEKKNIGLKAQKLVEMEFNNKDKALKNLIMTDVKIIEFNWHLGGFDSVMIADFTIENKSPNDIKDITVECINFAKSGTKLNNNSKIIYDVIKAGQRKKFKKINMGFIHGQTEKSSAKIIDLKILP